MAERDENHVTPSTNYSLTNKSLFRNASPRALSILCFSFLSRFFFPPLLYPFKTLINLSWLTRLMFPRPLSTILFRNTLNHFSYFLARIFPCGFFSSSRFESSTAKNIGDFFLPFLLRLKEYIYKGDNHLTWEDYPRYRVRKNKLQKDLVLFFQKKYINREIFFSALLMTQF